MKRYIIFAYDQYYPAGGLSDMLCEDDNRTPVSFDTVEEAKEYALNLKYKNDYVDIVDREKMVTVDEIVRKYE